MQLKNQNFEFRFPFQNWFDNDLKRQNTTLILSMIFLLVGYILTSQFGFTEAVLLPFSFSLIAYGTMAHESKKLPASFGIFTGHLAEDRAIFYIFLGIIFTVIIVFRVYFVSFL